MGAGRCSGSLTRDPSRQGRRRSQGGVMLTTTTVDADAAIEWYRRNRARSEAIFDLVDPRSYYSRPISLRNPIVFYEGHLPAFSVIAFLRRGLGRPPVDAS